MPLTQPLIAPKTTITTQIKHLPYAPLTANHKRLYHAPLTINHEYLSTSIPSTSSHTHRPSTLVPFNQPPPPHHANQAPPLRTIHFHALLVASHQTVLTL